MPREDGLKAGIPHQFSSTNQPARRGRLPSKLKKFCKDNTISKADIDMVFKNLIFGKTIEELQIMLNPDNREKLPVIVVLLVSAFIKDMNSGTLKEVNTVLDRIWGKPSQYVEISTVRSDIPEDPEERKRLIQEMEKEIALTVTGSMEPTVKQAMPEMSEAPKV